MKGKKPIKKYAGDKIKLPFFLCPRCKNEVGSYEFAYFDKFCSECGQKINWSDEL